MQVIIEMPLPVYNAFVDKCDQSSREYAILKSSIIIRRPEGDHFERIVEVDCTVKEATALLNLAKQLYPAVVPDIEKAIAAPNTPLYCASQAMARRAIRVLVTSRIFCSGN